MKVKVHSSEFGRALRILNSIIDTKIPNGRNVEITNDPNGLILRAMNSTMAIQMTIPMMGGDGEKINVDCQTLNSIVKLTSGEIELSSDEKSCTVKGNGRTRIPLMGTSIPELQTVEGDSIVFNADDMARAIGKVKYAVATDQTRIILTGILMETMENSINLVSLDGFQLSTESFNAKCTEGTKLVIPGVAMAKVCDSVSSGDGITMVTDGHRVRFSTDDTVIVCTLLQGEYIDYNRILPTEFKVGVRVNVEELKSVLRAGMAVNSKNHLVKLELNGDNLSLSSNSEIADFSGTIPCETQGDNMAIAFKDEYLMNALNAIGGEYTVINMNSSASPAVMKTEGEGNRLLLPVRIQG